MALCMCILTEQCFDFLSFHLLTADLDQRVIKKCSVSHSLAGRHLILAKKSTFFEKKGTKNFPTPYSIPLLSILHQNKALHNFYKNGQGPISRVYKRPELGSGHITILPREIWKKRETEDFGVRNNHKIIIHVIVKPFLSQLGKTYVKN